MIDPTSNVLVYRQHVAVVDYLCMSHPSTFNLLFCLSFLCGEDLGCRSMTLETCVKTMPTGGLKTAKDRAVFFALSWLCAVGASNSNPASATMPTSEEEKGKLEEGGKEEGGGMREEIGGRTEKREQGGGKREEGGGKRA